MMNINISRLAVFAVKKLTVKKLTVKKLAVKKLAVRKHAVKVFSVLMLAMLVTAQAPITAQAQVTGQAVKPVPDPEVKQQIADAKAMFDQNFKGAFQSYWTADIQKATEAWQTIIDNPKAINVQKIEAYTGLANCWFERLDVPNHLDMVNQTLEAATRLPNLTPDEQFEVKRNQGVAFQRQCKFDMAMQIYKSLLNDDLHIHKKTDLENRITTILLLQNRLDEAKAFFQQQKRSNLDIARLCMENGQSAQARQMFQNALNDKAQPKRTEALKGLLQTYAEEKNWKKVQELASQYIPELALQEKTAVNIYKDLISNWGFTRYGTADVPDFVIWCSQRYLSVPDTTPANVIRYSENIVRMATRKQDFNLARQTVDKALQLGNQKKTVNLPDGKTEEIPVVWVDELLTLRLYQVVFQSNDNPSGVTNRVVDLARESAQASGRRLNQQAVKQNKPADPAIEKLSEKQKEQALATAAKFAMEARFYKTAADVNQARERMLVQIKRPSIPCTYINNGPRDVSSFINSSYFRDEKNRAVCRHPYGDQLQFLLETDSAITGRVVTQSQAAPSQFISTCDQMGVYIFLFVPCNDIQNVMSGLKSVGGFEAYLAAGPTDPYYCYLIDLYPNCQVSDLFNTQYDNPNFRRVCRQEKTFDIEYGIVENSFLGSGVGVVLKISWSAFFDKLPANGRKWEFEAIAWEGGGRSWGGSNSVHQRSNYGDLVFANLTPENLNAIKRRVVIAAWNEYKNQSASRMNGFLEQWKDPELGDQAFYFKAVEPLEKELSELGAKVTAEMTPADVDMLYRDAVVRWMNVRYIIATLRSEYLLDQWFDE